MGQVVGAPDDLAGAGHEDEFMPVHRIVIHFGLIGHFKGTLQIGHASDVASPDIFVWNEVPALCDPVTDALDIALRRIESDEYQADVVAAQSCPAHQFDIVPAR